MYNEEQKKRFLLENESFEKGGISVWFKRVEDTERKKKKDLSEFTKEEILEVLLESTQKYSWRYLKQIVYFFRTYGNWCVEKVGLKENHFNEISLLELQDIVNKDRITESVITRKQILHWIKTGAIENAREQFCVLCMFEGIRGSNYEEIYNIKRSDLATENNRYYVFINRKVGSEYKKVKREISEELYKVALEADSATVYISYSALKPRRLCLKNSPYIVKEFYNASSSDDSTRGRTIYTALNRTLKTLYKKNVLKGELKPKDIYYSGIINDINEIAEKLNMDQTEVLQSDYIKAVEEKFNTTIDPSDYSYRYYDYLK